MTATDTIRRLQLNNGGLQINLALMTACGEPLSWWEVCYGDRVIKNGTIDGAHTVPELLKYVADNTTMSSDGGNVMLRSLTWQALDGCEHVSASELRAGDVLSLHGYGLVIESAEADGDNVIIMTGSMGYHAAGTRRCLPKAQLCNLIQRGPQ